jgi:hypothetical protein
MKDPRTIEEQAAQLARWLDEHPGSAPPEGVDPDVLETIYALRPELAPAPSFTIDDILADITCGPFAPSGAEPIAVAEQDIAPEVIEDEDEDEDELEPDTAVVDLATERRRRSPWLWSAAGAVAAAAMALIVATPFLDGGITDEAFYIQEAATPTAAPTSAASIPELTEEEPAAEPVAEPDDQPAELPRRQAPARLEGASAESALTLDGDREAEDREELGALGYIAAGESKDGLGAGRDLGVTRAADGRWASPGGGSPTDGLGVAPIEAPEAPAPPPAEPSPAATPVSGPEYAPAPSASPSQAAAAAPAPDVADFYDRSVADMLDDDAGWVEAEEEEARGSSVARRENGEKRKEAERERADEGEAELIMTEERLSASRTRRSRGGFGGLQGLASKSSPEPRMAELDEDAVAPAPATGSSAGLSLDQLRSQANPLDYDASWYLHHPSLDAATRARVAATYGQAQASIVGGDPAAAIAQLEALLGSGQPDLLQDLRFRIATLQLQRGQLSAARSSVQAGLAVSSAPTVYRSRLLALLGGILEEQGDASGAYDAYRQAVDANLAR